MQQDYYKEYYELERKHWWFVAREKIITDSIRKVLSTVQEDNRTISILNIGCGPGRSSEYLSLFGTVTSIEYDKDCCEFAAEKTGLTIINGSITDLPFIDQSFDLVCAFDVIEHVADDKLAVEEMKRVVKNGGLIFVTVPAFMSLWSHHDVVNHHFRRYRQSEIHKLFTAGQSGETLYATYFNFFLFLPIYGFRKISNLLRSGENRTGSGSDFEAFKPGMLNNMLQKVMNSESKLITRKIKLPFGVSILFGWKKGLS